MKYQVVLKFSASVIEDYDRLVLLEDSIAEVLEDVGIVDGHDAGSGEMNIFVLADNPKAVFNRIEPHFKTRGLLSSLEVAFRKLDGEDFTVLFPPGLAEFTTA